MGSDDRSAGSGGEPVESARRGRRQILDRQLARSDEYWARAVTELREGLIGMAAQLDELDRRVRELESGTGP